MAWLRGLTDLPVMVGFGIKDGASARAASRHADGAVVGSALVNTVAAHGSTPEQIPELLQAQAQEIRTALDDPDEPSR